MLVSCSMPCLAGRWPTLAFGALGARNTCVFRHPLCTQRSGRLFLIAMNETLTDHQRSIPICIPTHLTLWAGDQWYTVGIAFLWLPLYSIFNERATSKG